MYVNLRTAVRYKIKKTVTFGDTRSKPPMGRKRRPLIFRFVQPLWATCNDVALNIQTTPAVERLASIQAAPKLEGREGGVRPRHNDSAEYEVPDYLYLRRVVRTLKPGPQDVIFDLGCGKGRFLCLMARRRVRKCVGVELVPHLCEAARGNAARLRGRRAPIEIRCADAAAADPSEGTIYYMFNPFGPATMDEVLANIRGTLSRNPRNITIVYYNSVHEEMFEASGWLEKYHGFRVQSGMAVTFWRNRQGDNER
jgi:precorrin-6B methylase 2